MLIALLILQSVALLAILALSLRKTSGVSETDPRLAQLPEQLSRLIAEEARHTREDNATAAAALRSEVVSNIATLGQGLKDDLKTFREDNSTSATALRGDVQQNMRALSQSFSEFKNETAQKH